MHFTGTKMMRYAIVQGLCIMILVAGSAVSKDWSYGIEVGNGQDEWPNKFPACGGREQSPIAFWLHDMDVRAYSKKENGIQLENYDAVLRNATVLNSGYSVLVTIPDGYQLLLSGGYLPAKYKLLQIHFHWGHDEDEAGSEHRVGRGSYAMEAHFVHANVETGKPEAVLGVFYQLVETGDEKDVNLQMEGIVKYFDRVKYGKTLTQITDHLRVRDLLPRDLDDFIRYNGSLTTPPCTEGLTWTVFKSVQLITTQQLNQFRSLRDTNDEESIGDNHRLPQPLNNRTVILYTYQPSTAISASSGATASATRSSIFTLITFVISKLL